MARMKFLCDTKRCIECNGCVTACKNENDDALEWGIQRRRVVTLNDGEPGENSISVARMHCTDAPCMAVCPADCFVHTEDGIVLHNKDLCIGCGYCLFACPFGAPQFPKQAAFGERGKMEMYLLCWRPETKPGSEEERRKYGANRIAEGKLPMCASLCSTKALLAGDAEKISDIFRQRVVERGAKGAGWTNGEDLAYDATRS
uniref:formate dehydrogenase FDH3 subunit beta n=1 Tax=Vibrio cholerae TaxID=666 RepID=UPI003F584C58